MENDETRLRIAPPPVATTGAVVGRFATIGPLVGSCLMIGLVVLSNKRSSVAVLDSMWWVILISGYVFGVIPAALTGLAVAWTGGGRSGRLSAMTRGCGFGMLISAVTALLLQWLAGLSGLDIVFFAGIGGVAGLVCGWLTGGQAPR